MSKKKQKLSKEAQELNDKLVQLSKTTKTKPKQIKGSNPSLSAVLQSKNPAYDGFFTYMQALP